MDYDIIDMIWTMISQIKLWYHTSSWNHIYDITYDIAYDRNAASDVMVQIYDIMVHKIPMIHHTRYDMDYQYASLSDIIL